MRILIYSLVFFAILNPFIAVKAQITIPYPDQHIQTMGRVGQKPDAAEVYWSGTSFKINFQGTAISAILKDQRGENFFNFIVDGKVKKVQIDSVKKTYILASGLKPGRHTAELFKCTEWVNGKTWFYGFELSAGSKILAPPPLGKHKIEFYGNSITCGYAVEDFSGKDSYLSPYINNYLSYASITARHFNAQYSCISRSGIGIMLSWFPQTMPEMYNRLNPDDAASVWNFNKYQPEVVVINLFQNDSWLVHAPDRPEYKAKFGTTPPTEEYIIKSYQKFVKSIREKYPKAHIVCALGSMDATRQGSVWPGYIDKAVEGLKDPKITTHFFAYKNTGGHPSIKEQQAMADDLIGYIHTTFNW